MSLGGRGQGPLKIKAVGKEHTQTPTYPRSEKMGSLSPMAGVKTQAVAPQADEGPDWRGCAAPDLASHGFPENQQKAHTAIWEVAVGSHL